MNYQEIVTEVISSICPEATIVAIHPTTGAVAVYDKDNKQLNTYSHQEILGHYEVQEKPQPPKVDTLEDVLKQMFTPSSTPKDPRNIAEMYGTETTAKDLWKNNYPNLVHALDSELSKYQDSLDEEFSQNPDPVDCLVDYPTEEFSQETKPTLNDITSFNPNKPIAEEVAQYLNNEQPGKLATTVHNDGSIEVFIKHNTGHPNEGTTVTYSFEEVLAFYESVTNPLEV